MHPRRCERKALETSPNMWPFVNNSAERQAKRRKDEGEAANSFASSRQSFSKLISHAFSYLPHSNVLRGALQMFPYWASKATGLQTRSHAISYERVMPICKHAWNCKNIVEYKAFFQKSDTVWMRFVKDISTLVVIPFWTSSEYPMIFRINEFQSTRLEPHRLCPPHVIGLWSRPLHKLCDPVFLGTVFFMLHDRGSPLSDNAGSPSDCHSIIESFIHIPNFPKIFTFSVCPSSAHQCRLSCFFAHLYIKHCWLSHIL